MCQLLGSDARPSSVVQVCVCCVRDLAQFDDLGAACVRHVATVRQWVVPHGSSHQLWVLDSVGARGSWTTRCVSRGTSLERRLAPHRRHTQGPGSCCTLPRPLWWMPSELRLLVVLRAARSIRAPVRVTVPWCHVDSKCEHDSCSWLLQCATTADCGCGDGANTATWVCVAVPPCCVLCAAVSYSYMWTHIAQVLAPPKTTPPLSK